MVQLKTKASSLHDRLVATVERSEPITQFEIKAFEREISEIKAINLVSGLMLEGILYAISENEAACNKAHRQSIAAAPHNSQVHCNYGVSLKKFLHYGESVDYFYKAVKLSPRSLAAIGYLLNLILLTGRIELLPDVVYECKDKLPEVPFEELPYMNAALQYADIAERLKISSKDLQAVSAKVEEIAKRRNLALMSFTHRQGNFGGQGILHAMFAVNADGKTLFEMNEELHDFIAEDLNIESWEKLSFSFRRFPAEDNRKEFEIVG